MSDYQSVSALVLTLNETEWEEMLAAMAGKPIAIETLEYDTCSYCLGNGENVFNLSWSQNPEFDQTVNCENCNGTGDAVYLISNEPLDYSGAPEWWMNAHNGMES